MSTVEYNFEHHHIEIPGPLRRNGPCELNVSDGSSSSGSRRSPSSLDAKVGRETDSPQSELPSALPASQLESENLHRQRDPGPRHPKKLHRIAEVRAQQGVSVRSISRKLNLTAVEIRAQENPGCDLRLSELLKWQSALEVPLSELLVECDGSLSEPIGKRASMLRVMKTAKAIQETSEDRSMKRLADMLVNQLVQIMPELAEVSAWHTIGQRRTQNELGKIVERSIPDNFFSEPQF